MVTANSVFMLQPYPQAKAPNFNCLVIVPEGTSIETVSSAWAYAVRYTAKGLDLPDHEAAINLLSERHPSWTAIKSTVQTVNLNLALAEKDVPENQSS